MTRPELISALRELSEARIELAERKSENYSSGDDALENFLLIETLTHGQVSAAQGIYVRLCDKVARLGSLAFGGQDMVDEPLIDTLRDLANYADLMQICLRQQKQ